MAPLFAHAPANCYLPGIWVGRAATIVAGSRGISEAETMAHLDDWTFSGEIESGMAPGVDRGAAQWARTKGYPLIEAPALWNRYGRAAGPICNQWMSWYASYLWALWDGESRETGHMIQAAQLERAGGVPITAIEKVVCGSGG
ncbi:hypothetical protein [Acidithiobacillus sp.]|uniref:hypothetical protein n=1 Tax=Acidithiobacillus sp. TaxID=1872118 RepID=UPI003D01EE09